MTPLSWIRIGGALALGLFAAALFAHVRHIEKQAALVPTLEARIASDEARANALATALAKTDAARAEADRALSRWQVLKDNLLATLNKEARHATAAKNPLCAPHDDDRRLRNAALDRLLAGSE
jgi:hypothetical protein